MEQYSITKNYDIYGQTIWRTAKRILFGKCIPIGNLFGGAGMRCLLVLCMQHLFGRYVYIFAVRYGEGLFFLKKVLARL